MHGGSGSGSESSSSAAPAGRSPATLPLLIILFVAADDVLEAFSSRYDVGENALRVLLAGQTVNVATGGVAFILIMTGFTGVDLVDNAVGLGLLVGLAVALTAAFGIDGTAVAAAVSISLLNIVRLVQVRRRIGIQPYDRAYLGLALPAGAAALAALALHAALDGRPWWVSLAVTAAGCLAAYAALLPVVLPAGRESTSDRPDGMAQARARDVGGATLCLRTVPTVAAAMVAGC